MKIYSKKNVYEAAVERIKYLFDEFENVVVGFSGGKDSTVILNIALQVAEEKKRLPLKVLFIDQEAEWKGTIDYINMVMNDIRVEPMWFQMPMVITNNASSFNRYSYCWNQDEKDKWIHPQNNISIKNNVYGTDRFHDLFENIFKVEFKNKKSCYLSGVRAEESPMRFIALTDVLTYKYITWAKVLNKKYEHYSFYPLYDWTYTDVWKYIYDNNIIYNKVYDHMYKIGVNVKDMRISNLHHETAIQNLLLVQEIEPDTWNKIVNRIDGASSIKHIKKNSFTCPKELPFMFEDWEEYAMHLLENIIQDEKNKSKLNKILSGKNLYYNKDWHNNFSPKLKEDFWKKIIDTILSSDWDLTKITNFAINGDVMACRRIFEKRFNTITLHKNLKNKYLLPEHFELLKKYCKS